MKRAGRTSGAWAGILGLGLAVACVADDPSGDDGSVDTGADSDGDDGSGQDGMTAADGTDDGGAPPVDVPDNDYCAEVADWPESARQFEQRVVELVNDERAAGASCGGQPFGAAGPLTMQAALLCAARVHSLDMATRGFFDHDNPDGLDPFDRMALAGYEYQAAGENIAAGQTTPEEVVQGWMESPGHCSNIMDSDFTEIGVGYVQTSGAQYPHYWTQTFGRPG